MLPKIDNIHERSNRAETLDELNEDRNLLELILLNIAKVNKWLGGNSITVNALIKAAKRKDPNKKLVIVDIGCGGGDMCRQIARSSKKFKQGLEIIGVDINDLSLEISRDLSKDYKNIRFEKIDVFSEAFKDLQPDFVISTLTFHHFSDEEILKVLKICLSVDDIEIFINDLHRSSIAFNLFKPVSFILGLHPINRIDGLISILRSFKRKDLILYNEALKKEIPKLQTKIQWKWAFRYLWTLKAYES